MKTYRIYFILFFALLYALFGNVILLSQQPYSCLPGWNPQNNTEWFQSFKFPIDIKNIGVIGSVDFYWRDVNHPSQWEFFIDWSTLSNKNEALSEKALKEIIELYIITSFHQACPSLPVIDTWTRTYSFYYTSKCTYVKTSILKMNHDNTGVCCDDENDDPSLVSHQGSWFQLYQTKESCGTKCCRKDYTISCIERNGVMVTEVDPVVTTTSISECNGTVVPKCTDSSLPPIPDPVCTSGCD